MTATVVNVKDKVEKYTQSLKVRLTPEEIAERADRAANLVAKAAEAEEEMKAAKKHAQATIDQVVAEIAQLSNEVRTKSTYRPIECERRFLYEKGEMREVRLDTFETIGGRKLTEREMQMELPFDSDKGGD